MQSLSTSWRRTKAKKAADMKVQCLVLDPDAHWCHMYVLYNRLLATKGLQSFYWDNANPESLSLPQFFDMYKKGGNRYIIWIEWVEAKTDDIAAQLDLKDGKVYKKTDFMGFATIDISRDCHKGNLGIWIEPRWRGPNTMYITRQLLTFLHRMLKIQHIYAITPWNAAQQAASLCGMMNVATLPSFCRVKDKVKDAEVWYSDSESWKIQMVNHLIEDGWEPLSAQKLMAESWPEED